MKKLILLVVLMLGTLLNYSYAEDNPRAVIIFDASGSMWGQINGVTKLEIARDALKNVVTEWNPSVELGLTVYGHRKKGDCNDIETVIPAGKVDKNKVIRTVMDIQPKGKTPISRSLRKVADELKYTEEKATIILISDGKETCDPDPCAAAKALEQEGIDFITHVIGFNVDKKTSQQLECIAHATGGEYFSAKNAAGLNKAMKTIAKKVEVFVPPKPVVKKLTHNLEITASETKGGKWVDSRIGNSVNEEGEDVSIGTYGTYKNKTNNSLLPVGKYTLTDATYSGYKIEKVPFEIKEGEVTKLNIVFGLTGQVAITASETKGGKWVDARIANAINEEGENVSIGTYGTYKNKENISRLPVGKYTLTDVTYSGYKIDKVPFEIKAGEVTKLNIVLGSTGVVEVTTSEKEGGKWVEARCRTYNEDKSKDWYIGPRKKKAGNKKLPIGKYTLNCDYNYFKKKDIPFEIKAGETTKLHVVMGSTGVVEVTTSEKEGGKWVEARCRTYNEDKSKDWYIGPRKKKAGNKKLPIGKYTLNCSYNSLNKKGMPFEIKDGEVTKLHVIFEQFRIETKCTDMKSQVSYEVYASSGRMVYDTQKVCSEPVQLTLDAGDYSVEASIGNDKKEEKFSIGGSISKLFIDMTTIKKEPSKKELIEADRQDALVEEEAKIEQKPIEKSSKIDKSSPTVHIGNKTIEIEGISKKDQEDLKKAAKMLEMLGGMLGSMQQSNSQSNAKENNKADKEFEEMSKDLYMFTK